jgi:hypothetical protein
MGIHGVGGVHSSAHVKNVSSVKQAGQSETSVAPAAVTRTGDTYQGDFSSLVKAVQGGDISGAQSALTALQSDVAATSVTYSPASTSSPAPAVVASPAQNDLSALFQAVSGGDIAGAQAALGQLQVDVRSTGPHGDHASLQGQIHGRGHGRGHGHQASNLWTAVAAAFQSQTSAPAETTPPVTEPVTEPVTDPVTEPVTAPVTEPVTNAVADLIADSAPVNEVPVSVSPETTEPLPAVA